MRRGSTLSESVRAAAESAVPPVINEEEQAMDASSGNESENQQSASAPASFSSPSASSSLGEIVGDTVQIEQEARGSNPQIATTDRWEAEYETAGTRNVSSEQPSAAASAESATSDSAAAAEPAATGYMRSYPSRLSRLTETRENSTSAGAEAEAKSERVRKAAAEKGICSSSAVVPRTIYLLLDMEAGELSFIANGRYLGVAHHNLPRNRGPLHVAVSAVWGHCRVRLRHLASLSGTQPPSLRELCRRTVRLALPGPCHLLLHEMLPCSASAASQCSGKSSHLSSPSSSEHLLLTQCSSAGARQQLLADCLMRRLRRQQQQEQSDGGLTGPDSSSSSSSSTTGPK